MQTNLGFEAKGLAGVGIMTLNILPLLSKAPAALEEGTSPLSRAREPERSPQSTALSHFVVCFCNQLGNKLFQGEGTAQW